MQSLRALLGRIPFDLETQWSGPIALVGGAVRDALIGREREPLDLDFVAPGAAIEQARVLSRQLRAGYALLDPEHEIARLVLPGLTLDFAREQGGSLEADLGRRDFTVNSIAYDLRSGRVVDPLDGQGDLERRELCAVSEANLIDDPLRLLRGHRLAAQLGLSIAPATRTLIAQHAPRLASVSAERVREELCGLIAAPEAAPAIMDTYRQGLLDHWLPELSALEAVGPTDYYHLPLLEHTLEVLRQTGPAEARFGDLLGDALGQNVSGTRRVRTLVRLAALLQGIARPTPGTVGAKMAQAILQRLKFSRDEERWVTTLIQHHRRPGELAGQKSPSRRALYHLYRDTGEMLPALLVLAMADCYASRGPRVDPADIEGAEEFTRSTLERYFDPEDPVAHPANLLDGHGLMGELHLAPGPRVGKILAAIQEAQAAGEVTSREEALALARQLM